MKRPPGTDDEVKNVMGVVVAGPARFKYGVGAREYALQYMERRQKSE